MALDPSIVLPDPPRSSADDDRAWKSWCDYRDEVERALGIDGAARWAGPDVDMRERAFAGRWRARYDVHWGRGSIASPAMVDPTWAELFLAAARLVEASGDDHHRFVEAFEPDGEGWLELITGS